MGNLYAVKNINSTKSRLTKNSKFAITVLFLDMNS